MDEMMIELIDREKIRDCMMRYAQGVDRCDIDVLKSVYWPDGTDWHGDFNGNAHEFCNFIIPVLQKTMVMCQHFLGGSLIRFVDRTSALVETYSQNFHVMRNEDGDNYDLVVGSRYLDKMEKRSDEWRILNRVVMVEWVNTGTKSVDLSHGLGPINPKLNGGAAPVSKRKPDDMIYTFLENLGQMPIFNRH